MSVSDKNGYFIVEVILTCLRNIILLYKTSNNWWWSKKVPKKVQNRVSLQVWTGETPPPLYGLDLCRSIATIELVI